MTPKTIARLLIVSALATAGANSASAGGGGFRDGGSFRGGQHRTRPPVVVGGFVGVDGYAGGYGNGGGYGDGYGNGGAPSTSSEMAPVDRAPRNGGDKEKGSGDWHGISTGHNDWMDGKFGSFRSVREVEQDADR